jgi:hypothetical protein
MASKVDVRITTNLPDFKKQMERFGAKLEGEINKKAAFAATQVFKRAVIAGAPQLKKPTKARERGVLRRAIYVYRQRKAQPGTAAYTVSFRKGKSQQSVRIKRKGVSSVVNRDAFYGRFLELGWIPRGPGRKLRGGRRSRELKRLRALQAGATKITRYRFLSPAFKRVESAALQAFTATMQREINKANRER